eukprot:1231113-Pleurochrysis_carterae.AAC.3
MQDTKCWAALIATYCLRRPSRAHRHDLYDAQQILIRVKFTSRLVLTLCRCERSWTQEYRYGKRHPKASCNGVPIVRPNGSVPTTPPFGFLALPCGTSATSVSKVTFRSHQCDMFMIAQTERSKRQRPV